MRHNRVGNFMLVHPLKTLLEESHGKTAKPFMSRHFDLSRHGGNPRFLGVRSFDSVPEKHRDFAQDDVGL